MGKTGEKNNKGIMLTLIEEKGEKEKGGEREVKRGTRGRGEGGKRDFLYSILITHP